MREIAILSGKGGTGKSSISAAFATLERQVMVADCDVDAANMHLILEPHNFHEEFFTTGYKAFIDPVICNNCGLCFEYCRFNAITFTNNHAVISETSCDGCKLCSKICPEDAISNIQQNKSKWFAGTFRNGFMAHARLAPGEENSGKLVNIVRTNAKKIASENNINTIIIDGPPGTGCPAISTLTGVTLVLIVTEPSKSGFHDLQRILELADNFKIQALVAINKYDLNLQLSDVIINWCKSRVVEVIGKIPFDKAIVEAMVHCKSIIEWAPDSPASKEISKIWKLINTQN